MSFTGEIKLEIIESRPPRSKTGEAFAYGMLLFAPRCDIEEISVTSSSKEVAGRFERTLRILCGKDADIAVSCRERRGREYWSVALSSIDVRRRLLGRYPSGEIDMERFRSPEDIQAFLAGAFLSCGSMTHPEKGYHLEFSARTEDLARELAGLIDSLVPSARVTRRRGQWVVYCKECAQIEDILTMMGASRACLAVIDVEMIKGLRNRVNRATNCETANIDKQVGAAATQLEDIRLIYETAGEESLSDNLKAAARLRLENPEASLRELVELSHTPVSRSGMHHRLAALGRMAEQIREEKGKLQSNG